MIIVNTSFHLDKTLEPSFRRWADEYRAIVRKATNDDPADSLSRLLMEVEPGTVSYALQFRTPNVESAQAWFENHGNALLANITNAHPQRIVHFTTLMETVE